MPNGISLGDVNILESAVKTTYEWIRKAATLDDEVIFKYFGKGMNLYDILKNYDHKEFIKIMEKIMEDEVHGKH